MKLPIDIPALLTAAIDSIQERNHRARTFLKKFSQIRKRIIPHALMPFSKMIAPAMLHTK